MREVPRRIAAPGKDRGAVAERVVVYEIERDAGVDAQGLAHGIGVAAATGGS